MNYPLHMNASTTRAGVGIVTEAARPTQPSAVAAARTGTAVPAAMIGFGPVGQALYRALNLEELLPGFRVCKVLVRDQNKLRTVQDLDGCPVAVPSSLIANSVEEIFADNDFSIVVDVSNMEEPSVICRALSSGRPVVSANKRLLASHGREFIRAAEDGGTFFLNEAAALGKVPVFKFISEFCARLRILRFETICNGTTNFILTQIANAGLSFEDALREAQSNKYAEADASSDIDGLDALHKAKLLTATAFGLDILAAETDEYIYCDGIRDIAEATCTFAAHCGRVVKLVATSEMTDWGVAIRIMPTLLPKHSFLGSLEGVENGIVVHDQLGPASEFAGPGAGPDATAAAFLSDLATARECMENATVPRAFARLTSADTNRLLPKETGTVRPVFQSYSPLHQVGVLAAKADVVCSHGISVEQIYNSTRGMTDLTPDVIIGERTTMGQALSAARELSNLRCVTGAVKLLDVAGDEPIDLDVLI